MSNELEQHRFTFEGATGLLAAHLIDEHGVPAKDVARWHNGMTQGHWVALDDLHKQAHESTKGDGVSNELREAAQRVTGYIRARALMSNTDSEVISDIAVMPAGAENPMEFRLLVSDLEALTSHAVSSIPNACDFMAAPEWRCTAWVLDTSGVSHRRVCGLTLDANGTCPRPEKEHIR